MFLRFDKGNMKLHTMSPLLIFGGARGLKFSLEGCFSLQSCSARYASQNKNAKKVDAHEAHDRHDATTLVIMRQDIVATIEVML